MNNIKSICVFCGANPGKSKDFVENTEFLAEMLVSNNIRLIYGGAALGLMGAIASAVIARGGIAIGVMPRMMIDKELAHKNLTELHIVETMHERKALMADLSDAFLLYPGGIGSLDEFFEIWTWAQISIHNKPYGILNINNYYDKLIDFMNHVADEEFIHYKHVDNLLIDQDPNKLLKKFISYVPIKLNKNLALELRKLID